MAINKIIIQEVEAKSKRYCRMIIFSIKYLRVILDLIFNVVKRFVFCAKKLFDHMPQE